jgi:hypothetical protein
VLQSAAQAVAGTVIWGLPGAHAHVTSPGNALLF